MSSTTSRSKTPPRRGRRIRRTAWSALLAGTLALLLPALGSAATLQVAEDGADTGDCTSAPCATIAYAVSAASPNDTVAVAAGTYQVGATVVISKAVTIAGAQAGVDARARAVPTAQETVIEPSDAFFGTAPLLRLSAPGATVDGVTVRDHLGAAVQMMNSSSGYAVRNSILTGNDVGVDLETTATDAEPTVVERNRFVANNSRSLRSGIYGDDTAQLVTIRDNSFAGHTNVPINISGKATDQGELEISGNEFDNERHVLLLAADEVLVTANTFTAGRSQAISVQGGLHDLEISSNTIDGSADAGILFVDYYDAGPSTDTSIVGNTISGTGTGGAVDTAAISVSDRKTDGSLGGSPGYTGTLTVAGNLLADNAGPGIYNGLEGATVAGGENWWGCNAGPGSEGCATVVATER